MSEVQKLNEAISEAKEAANKALEAADQAQYDYDAAIEAGDVQAADRALQDQARHERTAQIQQDRAEALENRRTNAERVDRTPAAHEAIKEAQRAVEVEAGAVSEVQQAINALELAVSGLRSRLVVTDAAINRANDAIKAAHLMEHEGVMRPGFYDDGSRLNALARTLASTRPVAHSIHEGFSLTNMLAQRN
jgi:chromosome segregation ATPase